MDAVEAKYVSLELKKHLTEKDIHPDWLEWRCYCESDGDRELLRLFGAEALVVVPLFQEERRFAKQLLETDLSFLAIAAKHGCEFRYVVVEEEKQQVHEDLLHGFTAFLVMYEMKQEWLSDGD